METTKELAAEAAHGWSDTVGEWLAGAVGQALSVFEPMMSPDVFASLSKTLATFIFIFTELTLLFIVISFVVGLLQGYIPPHKIKALLSRKRGYVMAAVLGAITPFCSCSTIPFLRGLIRAGAGFGGMMVFLLASPLLNPIIIGLFFISFGLKVAVYYFAVAMVFSIVAGIVLEHLGFEKYIQPSADSESEGASCGCPSNQDAPTLERVPATSTACCGDRVAPRFEPVPVVACCGSVAVPSLNVPKFSSLQPLNTGAVRKKTGVFADKSRSAWKQAKADFRQAFIYLLLGVVIGSVIYGFVPDTLISQYAGGDSPLAIPFAAVVGVPLYVRAEAVIPISLGLVEKGMSMGAVMAFIIGSAGASLTEVILLRSLFKRQIIIAFLIVVLSMAVFAGYMMPIIL